MITAGYIPEKGDAALKSKILAALAGILVLAGGYPVGAEPYVLIATDLALTVQRCSLLRIRVSTPAVLTALTGTAEEISAAVPITTEDK